ncbi:hypothetical protein JW968_01750 [Candidatus Woesearchaeota archaeon]|nr:hypothetical protein [Candidatus Woesearchaeota archaeon]
MKYQIPINIVGFGNVGRELASLLVGKTPEINVYTRGSRPESLAALDDLRTGAVIDGSGTRIMRVDDVLEINPNGITIVTAKEGYNYKDYPPEDIRLVGLKYDPSMIRRIAERTAENGFEGSVVMVTNPVNPLCTYFQRYSGIADHQVYAFGPVLDTGRYVEQIVKHVISDPKRYGINPSELEVAARVIGEHGPTQVFPESQLRINGKSLEDIGLTHEDMVDIQKKAMMDGPRIAVMQGGTWYGPAHGLMRTIDFILAENHPITVEGVKFRDHVIGLPVSKKDGKVVFHYDILTDAEKDDFERSYARICEIYDLIMKEFDTTKQRRDILLLDDIPGVAQGKAERLAEMFLDDPEINEHNELFFGFSEEPSMYIVRENGGFKLNPLDTLKYDDDAGEFDPTGHRLIGGPDVLIFDHVLGHGTNGLEVARHIKQQYQNTRVVILTGQAQFNDILKMANEELVTRSGKRVKVVDGVIQKQSENEDANLYTRVKELLKETQFRTA